MTRPLSNAPNFEKRKTLNSTINYFAKKIVSHNDFIDIVKNHSLDIRLPSCGEGLVTQNLINDVRWKFQKLNITRANINCFVLP